MNSDSGAIARAIAHLEYFEQLRERSAATETDIASLREAERAEAKERD